MHYVCASGDSLPRVIVNPIARLESKCRTRKHESILGALTRDRVQCARYNITEERKWQERKVLHETELCKPRKLE
jgi:hypothetical protein